MSSQSRRRRYSMARLTNDSPRSHFTVEADINDPVTLNFTAVPYKVSRAKAQLSQKQNVLSVAAQATTERGVQQPPVVEIVNQANVTFQGDFRVGRPVSPVVNRWRLDIPPGPDALVTLGGKTILVKGVQGTVAMNQGTLDITALGTVAGGSVNTELHWDKISQPLFSGEVLLAQASFNELSQILNPSSMPTQGKITTAFRFTNSNSLETLNGSGQLLLEENDVFSVPLLGPLSGFVSAIFPLSKVIYSRARDASGDFTVTNGIVETKAFKAKTPAFELTVSGLINLPQDRLGLTARMNLRGIPGILFFPVSKIMEYEAGGTLTEPGWTPKILPNLGR